MSEYCGKAVTVGQPVDELYSKVSNFSTFQERINSLPEDVRGKMPPVAFTDDKMTINAPGVGEITFAVVERIAPELLRLAAENSPIPFEVVMNFSPVDEVSSKIETKLDVEIPMMLRPLVGGKLQEAADKISEMFANFFKA